MITKSGINDINNIMDVTLKMVSSFKGNDLALAIEEVVYAEEITNAIKELESELVKAKKIINDNDRTTN